MTVETGPKKKNLVPTSASPVLSQMRLRLPQLRTERRHLDKISPRSHWVTFRGQGRRLYTLTTGASLRELYIFEPQTMVGVLSASSPDDEIRGLESSEDSPWKVTQC